MKPHLVKGLQHKWRAFNLKLNGILRGPCRLGCRCPRADMDFWGTSGGPSENLIDPLSRTGCTVYGSHFEE